MSKKISLIITLIVIVVAVAVVIGLFQTSPDRAHTDGLEVVLITEASGIEDGSFNQAAYEGAVKYFEEFNNGALRVVVSENSDTLLSNLMMASDEAPSLIIASGFNFVDPLGKVAELYPDQKYLLIDGFVDAPNVESVSFDEYRAGYLAGRATARAAEFDNRANDSVYGILKGMDVPATNDYESGFKVGVKELIPDAQFTTTTLGSWTDTAKAKMFSKMLSDSQKNLYAIFVLAGNANGGAIAFAKELYSTDKRFYIVGCDTDIYNQGLIEDSSVVLTSALKRVNVPVYDTLKKLAHGEFTAGITNYSEENSGVGLALTGDKIKEVLKNGL